MADAKGAAGPSGPRDLSMLVKEVETALAEKVEEVRRQEDRVNAERKHLAEEKAAMAVVGASITAGDIIRLNVGGRLFTTKRGTLIQVEGSVLEGMFSGRWDKSFDLDDEGRIFLDLDPDCFAEVLHQLRLLQLNGSADINWSKVPAPDHREAYFRAMLDFLGLAKLPAFAPKFAYYHPHMSRGEDEMSVTSGSDGHKWAVGDTVMEAGTYMWGFKIRTLKNNHWVFLGVIAHTRPGDNSYSDATSYGWACKGASARCQAYVKGAEMPEYGGWSGFQEGDDVTMQLNVDSGVLRMKVARLQQTVFHFTGMQLAPWRVHINLFCAGDRVDLLSAVQF